MFEISVEEAYKEACLALGEATVRERLLSARFIKYAASTNDGGAGKDVAGDSAEGEGRLRPDEFTRPERVSGHQERQ